MKDNIILQSFINNFRRHIAPFLKPNVGLTCKIFPVKQGGAILELTIGVGIANDDLFESVTSNVSEALGKVKQHAFGGNLAGFKFSGTNVVMEESRIILIKGEDDVNAWDDKAALADVNRILPPSKGGQR
jgi:hypothetical protein